MVNGPSRPTRMQTDTLACFTQSCGHRATQKREATVGTVSCAVRYGSVFFCRKGSGMHAAEASRAADRGAERCIVEGPVNDEEAAINQRQAGSGPLRSFSPIGRQARCRSLLKF
jgi:hypothetical protein